MVRYFAPLLLLVPALSAFPPQWAQFLPATANIKAMQADAQGNIYLAGSVVPSAPKDANDTSDAFVAKYSSDGAQLFRHSFGGPNADQVNALAIGSDGSVYLAGNTSSADFPVTGAAQLPPASGSGGPFLVKLDPSGATAFAYVYGRDTSLAAIAVDVHGQAVVTGMRNSGGTPGLVAKLSQDGTRVLFTFANYGGTAVALDAEGSIYVAGLTSEYDPVMTPGAFQTTHASAGCVGTAQIGFPCFYQHVAKISADGAKLFYATFLDGTNGATPSGLAVDAAGNAIVAGSTYSSDFPATPGSLQSVYTAAGLPPLQPTVAFPSFGPPPSSGFVTKLNASGTGLVWSTFFSGTRQDAVSSFGVASDLSLYIAGLAGSDDLPGLSSTVVGCRPKVQQYVPFVAHLNADGSGIFSTVLFGDTVPNLFAGPLVADGTRGVAATAGAELASLDFESPPVACVVDAADTAPVASVAPGQLVTLFGTDIAQPSPISATKSFPTQAGHVALTFNGIPAPLLYVGENQINAQVPFEVAGAGTVEMKLTSQTPGGEPVGDVQTLRVVAASPALFRSRETQPVCLNFAQGQEVLVPLARNPDGSFNSSCNPAPYGSTVTLYVNGAGALGIDETTGAIATGPAAPVNVGIGNGYVELQPAVAVTGATTMPGSISGLVQIQVKLPDYTSDAFFQLNLQQGALPFRDTGAIIWAKLPAQK